jgi:hypothetical protein
METDIAALVRDVEASPLSDAVRQRAVWLLQQLPGLYHEFEQTYESRYREHILVVQGMLLQKLAEEARGSREAAALLAALRAGLAACNARCGIEEPKQSARKKAG